MYMYVYVKASIVYVNKCLKPFFLEQHIESRFKAFGLSVHVVYFQSMQFM